MGRGDDIPTYLYRGGMMQHLFQAWQDFLKDYGSASHLLFLSDFDGTLATIVGRPDEARLSAGAREKLVALTQRPRTSVGVISGRSLKEIQAMVGIAGIYYSGNHGLEIEGPGLKYIHPQAEKSRGLMKDLAVQFTAALKDIEGVIVQEKGLSLSVHYRLVRPEDESAVAGAVKEITGQYVAKGEIRVYPMKKIWEIRSPLDWDKGKAVALIVKEIRDRLKPGRTLTVYLGDDATDEDAFRVMRRPEGWGVYVGGEDKKTAAGYFLRSTAEVETLLDRLLTLR
jgi:trehalose-phosphatase